MLWKKKSFSLIGLFLTVLVYSFALFGQTGPDVLKERDIAAILDKILSEHLGKKELSGKIIQNALVLYINQFDPQRIYLLDGEVAPYLTLGEEQVKTILAESKKSDFSIFYKLNQTIQQAIERSRKIRAGLEANVVESAFEKKVALREKEGSSDFAKTVLELRERLLRFLENYIEEKKQRYGILKTVERKKQVIADFELSLRDLENQYLFQDQQGKLLPLAQRENLFSIHVLKALAASLDSHTSFYKSNEAFDIRLRLQKEFKGIGLILQDTNQGVVVTHLLSGGPAERTKLIEVGDILVKIDGKSVGDISFEKIMEMLHGEQESEIVLEFIRDRKDGKKTYTVALKKEMIVLHKDRVDVSSEPFGNGILGIIKLHAFYQSEHVSSEQDIRDAIAGLKKKGNLRGLILDLRENGGGFLSQAVKVAGLFISDGIVVISKYASGEDKIYRDVDGKTYYDGPLIVLTSKASASASEIVAQALQDYGVALVVGDEHTYGKGTIQTQTITDGESSSYFKVTVGKYYTVSGHTPQKEGVKADVVVPGHWSEEKIGELYANSVAADTIAPLYEDTLKDVPESQRSWYMKYYMPALQKKTDTWQKLVPQLRVNSSYRIAHNKNYQHFLKKVQGKEDDLSAEDDSDDEWSSGTSENKNYGEDDLQQQEAFSILKDMIIMHHAQETKPKT